MGGENQYGDYDYGREPRRAKENVKTPLLNPAAAFTMGFGSEGSRAPSHLLAKDIDWQRSVVGCDDDAGERDSRAHSRQIDLIKI